MIALPVNKLGSVAVITLRDDLGLGGADQDDMNAARTPQPRAGRHREAGPARNGRLDDASVERVLRGERVPGADAAALRRLLDAATAPATAYELRHAEAAAGAYAAVHAEAAHGHRPAVLLGRRAGRLLGLKVAALIAAATTASGLALAATTGVLPTPLRPRPALTSGPASSAPVRASAATSTQPHPTPSAAPNVAALCTAYDATPSAQRQKVLTTPGFAALVAAAGGADKVSAYCAARGGRTPAPHATPSRHAAGKPTAHPSFPVTTGGPVVVPSPNRQTR